MTSSASAASSPSVSSIAPDQSDLPFDQLSAPRQAASRWVDAWRVVGGSSPEHEDSLEALGWTWKEFGQALRTYRTHSEHDRLGEAIDLMDRWESEAWEEDEAALLMCSALSWCFSGRSDWESSEGCEIHAWITEAPWFEFEALQMPVPLLESMEGIWTIAPDEESQEEAVVVAWKQMEDWGFEFCQKPNLIRKAYYSSVCSREDIKTQSEYVMGILKAPMLAKEEAKLLDEQTRALSLPSHKRQASI